MTDNAVQISITVRVAKSEKIIEETVRMDNMEESLQRVSIAVGQESMAMSVKEIDNRISKQVPKSWRNVGTEERWLVSSLGAMRYKRRVYLDEKKQRRRPMDEMLGIKSYDRTSGRVQEIGASLATRRTIIDYD